MKRRILAGLAVVVLSLVAAGAIWVPIARERARRTKCLAPLECCIRKALMMYSMDNHGRFPPKLAEMAREYANNPKLFVCPSTRTVYGSTTNVDDWMDYVYVYWPDGEKTPTNYPWIYERRLSNHGGGIYVAPIGGHAFWDEGAQWLKNFAKEHPEFKIRMPDDLK